MAPKTLHALLALTTLVGVPMAGVPLVLAQTESVAPQAAEPAAPEVPQAVPAAAPIAAPPPPPVRVAPTAAASPAPLQPGEQERLSRPPMRFDASLDALVRDRVISPNERVRVRGGFVMPQSPNLRQEACSSGALSAQECNGAGVVVVGRGRLDGGSFSSSGAGEGSADGSLAGLGGERYGIDAAPLPPISVPVGALLAGAGGSFRLTDVFRVTPRPSPIAGNGNARLLFPLIGAAVTTSQFGWRLHPVMGSWLMHAGRDLAAPEGTPVVASLTGRVMSSGVAGGYGLAVEIEHERPRRRTLYGHLSELYVKEGDFVRQGEVIGRVGSTGLSTGPHLHFELRLPQDGGWVATDPGDLDPGGGSMIAGLPGLAGLLQGGRTADGPQSDAVAMLMGQLIETLERPRSPLLLPGAAPSMSTPPIRPPAAAPTPASSPLTRG